jgi:hypothetical protein
MDSSNRSNASDRPVRLVAVYADGRVSHRDLTKGRAPWNTGAGWGRAGAHALPSDSPTPPKPAKAKDPKKVAAGKARAAQAKARTGGKFTKAAPTPAPAPKAPTPKAAKSPKSKTGAAPMVVVAFRATEAQKRKFEKLGGGEWARKRIDAAGGV